MQTGQWSIFAAAIVIAFMLVGCKDSSQPEPAAQTIQTDNGPMVLVPAGFFEMGSGQGQADEKPVRKVWIDSFLMDKYEVTQEQYKKLRNDDPSHFKGADSPVEQVSWGQAAWYCNTRSRAEGLQPCYDEQTGACNFDADGYHLPTEAEWEYAARAGSSADFCFGDQRRKLAVYGWFADNSAGRTHPVGRKRPNRWGICDMHGNVLEWCNDVYGADYYGAGQNNNPRGPAEVPTSKFVLRGGAWNSSASVCRSGYRVGEFPGEIDGCFARDDIGFRCVRKAPQKKTAQAAEPDDPNSAK